MHIDQIFSIIFNKVTFFISLLGNLILIYRELKNPLKKKFYSRMIYKFWGKPGDIHILYPVYRDPRIGRTIKGAGDYIASEDAKAVELLNKQLSKFETTLI